jgi:hypothetical protein
MLKALKMSRRIFERPHMNFSEGLTNVFQKIKDVLRGHGEHISPANKLATPPVLFSFGCAACAVADSPFARARLEDLPDFTAEGSSSRAASPNTPAA